MELQYLNDTHLLRMTDDTGIYQHAMYDVPDPRHGYTTDDNARLILTGILGWEATGQRRYLDLCYRGLRFLIAAEKSGWFRNFMGWDRRFLEQSGSQDCVGRCILSLSETSVCTSLPEPLRHTARDLLLAILPSIRKLAYPRSRAYAALGLAALQLHDPQEERARDIQALLRPMADCYTGNVKSGWLWFEDILTYCSAVIPHAFLMAGEQAGLASYRSIGLGSLDFLLEKTIQDQVFVPIGNDGWFTRGGTPAVYDQQPVEACATLLACLTAHRLTKGSHYLDAAECCLAWFGGKNSQNRTMIDEASGGCYDGLQPGGPNYNQGAESLLSWLSSNWAMYLYKTEGRRALPDGNQNRQPQGCSPLHTTGLWPPAHV